MKTAIAIFAYLVLCAATALTTSYFAVDMPAVSAYIHAQSERAVECRDPRVRGVLLDFADRTHPFRPDPWHYGPRWTIIRVVTLPIDKTRYGTHNSVREVGRLLLSSLLIPEAEIAGAYCQIGFVSEARKVGVAGIRTLSNHDLFAIAAIYDAAGSYTSGGSFDLPWLFKQLRAESDENRMAERYWYLRRQALRPE